MTKIMVVEFLKSFSTKAFTYLMKLQQFAQQS